MRPERAHDVGGDKDSSEHEYITGIRMWEFLHSDEPGGELWVGVTLNGWKPMIRAQRYQTPESRNFLKNSRSRR